MHFLAIEELSRFYREVSTVKESRWIEEAIEKLSSKQKVSRWIEVAIENAIKSNKRVSIDKLAVERCPAAIKIT